MTYLVLRRIVDFTIAVLVLILISPLMIIVAIAISMDGGPVFFLQERLGLQAKPFRVFKLRSMIVDADRFLDASGVPLQKRTTAVGEFIRKTSIDELPQLLNVIRGEMGLIGPRPILPRMLPFMTDFELRRFEVLPGLTGLAQIRGRNHVPWSRRFKYDVFYVNKISFSFDTLIFWHTVKTVLFVKGIVTDRNSESVDDVTVRKVARQTP